MIISLNHVHDVVWRLFIAYSPLSELLKQAMEWATSCKSSRLALCFTVIGFFFPHNHPKIPEFLELKFFCKPPHKIAACVTKKNQQQNRAKEKGKLSLEGCLVPRGVLADSRATGISPSVLCVHAKRSHGPLRGTPWWLLQLRFLFSTLETPTKEAASKVTFSEQRQTIKLWDEKPENPGNQAPTM